MGYCSVQEVERIMAQSLTSATDGTSTTRGNLINVGRTRDNSLIQTEIIDQYILWAGMSIDSTLSHQYKVPFCELSDFEGVLAADIGEYNNYIVLELACPLVPGDNVVVTDGVNTERLIIDTIVAEDTFSTEDPFVVSFSSGARVLRVGYPVPIPSICANLSASSIYDKYLYAQNNPNATVYGQRLRTIARQMLDNVLNGRTTLVGQERVGRTLYDPNIDSQYDTFKGTEGPKDIDTFER